MYALFGCSSPIIIIDHILVVWCVWNGHTNAYVRMTLAAVGFFVVAGAGTGATVFLLHFANVRVQTLARVIFMLFFFDVRAPARQSYGRRFCYAEIYVCIFFIPDS